VQLVILFPVTNSDETGSDKLRYSVLSVAHEVFAHIQEFDPELYDHLQHKVIVVHYKVFHMRQVNKILAGNIS
jgi:hypothetical protein